MAAERENMSQRVTLRKERESMCSGKEEKTEVIRKKEVKCEYFLLIHCIRKHDICVTCEEGNDRDPVTFSFSVNVAKEKRVSERQ